MVERAGSLSVHRSASILDERWALLQLVRWLVAFEVRGLQTFLSVVAQD
jgi:hypothetical protein